MRRLRPSLPAPPLPRRATNPSPAAPVLRQALGAVVLLLAGAGVARASSPGAGLRLGGRAADDGAGPASFLTQLAVHEAAGLSAQELPEELLTDPILLRDAAAATDDPVTADAASPEMVLNW